MLYKYLPPDRIDVLEDLKIRFTQLSSLNDPFENKPLLYNKILHDAGKKDLKERMAGYRQSQKNSKEEINSLDAVEKEANKHLEQMASPEEFGNRFMKQLDNMLHVLSLSATEQSLLMWSHYCMSHTGFVLEIDDRHDFLHAQNADGSPSKPYPISYTSRRPMADQHVEKLTEFLFTKKPIEWAYEEEYRVFQGSVYDDKALLDKNGDFEIDDFDNKIYLLDIPQELIKGVIIGMDMSTKNEDRLKAACHKIGCENIKKAKLSESEYKLEFIDL